MPLAAMLMVPLLGMLALAVDLGWAAVTQAELQNAADSAALAAAGQMASGFTQYNLPGQTEGDAILAVAEQNAVTFAQRFAVNNAAADVRSLALDASDVVFGFTDASGTFSTAFSGYPNTVQVTVRRDGSANGSLPLFFAQILGISTLDLSATAAATIYAGGAENGFTGFNRSSPFKGSFLPVALDVTVWNNYLATGQSADGNVHNDSSGVPQLNVFPNPSSAQGSFGAVNIGPPPSATNFSTWIKSGPSSTDLAFLTNNGSVPVSTSNARSWSAGPTLTSSNLADFQTVVGAARSVILFEPPAPTSSTGSYNVVGFGGITIKSATVVSGQLNLSIQPIAVFDPSIAYDGTSVLPAGVQAGLTTVFTEPKLTN